MTDGSYTVYGYDDDGQLVSSLGFTAGGTPIAAEQLGYGYDPGWNMTNRSVNGTATTYAVNDLNEVTNDGVGLYYYDQNGNRTNKYAPYKYTYDDENRLTQVSDDTGHTFRTGFTYDGLGRLRLRQVYWWYSQYSVWIPSDQFRYLYDGNRVVQERINGIPMTAYTRGSDLSGSLEGAGGIGGLLARSDTYSSGNWTRNSFYHADGNGNVTCLVNTNLAVVARYKYDPYGRTLSSSGSLASANVYRFSSKEIHPESGMYCYLYRCYDPNVQRWISRDPLGDNAFFQLYSRGKEWEEVQSLRFEGLRNTYTFVHNGPISDIDFQGLSIFPGFWRPLWDLRHGGLPGLVGRCAAAVISPAGIIIGNDLEEWTGSPHGFPTANEDDRLQHCISSCKIARACGSPNAAGLGYIKELNDLLHGGSWDDSKGDLAANAHGRNGSNCPQSCEEYCNGTRGQYPPAYQPR